MVCTKMVCKSLRHTPRWRTHLCYRLGYNICSLQFTITLHRCRTHPWTMESTLLLYRFCFLKSGNASSSRLTGFPASTSTVLARGWDGKTAAHFLVWERLLPHLLRVTHVKVPEHRCVTRSCVVCFVCCVSDGLDMCLAAAVNHKLRWLKCRLTLSCWRSLRQLSSPVLQGFLLKM